MNRKNNETIETAQFKIRFLSALHDAIEMYLESLQSLKAKGVKVLTKQGYNVHMHFMVASFIEDKPEMEDLLGVKRGNKKFHHGMHV